MGIHTFFVLLVWERSMHGQRSRALDVSTAMCFPCGHSDPTWRSFTTRALAFPRGLVPLLPRHSEGCSPGVRKWILSVGLETGTALSLPSHYRSSASSQGWEARAAVSSAPIEAQTLQLSDSEELDIVSLDVRDTEDSPPQSRAYEELVEVVIRAVVWPAEREDVRSKKKKKTNASCLLVHTFNAGNCDATPRCRDRGINRIPIEFIVHKHLTIPL